MDVLVDLVGAMCDNSSAFRIISSVCWYRDGAVLSSLMYYVSVHVLYLSIPTRYIGTAHGAVLPFSWWCSNESGVILVISLNYNK